MSMANFQDEKQIAVLIESNQKYVWFIDPFLTCFNFYIFRLNFGSGVVIACPAPNEIAIDYKLIQDCAHQALMEGQAEELSGFRLTNFLNDRTYELCDMNFEMMKSIYSNNAEKAASIAIALNKGG